MFYKAVFLDYNNDDDDDDDDDDGNDDAEIVVRNCETVPPHSCIPSSALPHR